MSLVGEHEPARNSITACDDHGVQLSSRYLDLRSLVSVITCPVDYGDNAELIRSLATAAAYRPGTRAESVAPGDWWRSLKSPR
jgi:hypothetical protein